MRNQTISLAALSALLVLPMAGGFAQDNTRTTTDMMRDSAKSDNVVLMDTSQFKDTLYRLRELFEDMNKEHRLALASTDPLIVSMHQENNKALLNEALDLADTIIRHTTYESVREQAAQGDDTAFVRMNMWDISNALQADKLNGRDGYINSELWATLTESIHRVESPSFHVAYIPMNLDRLNQPITLSSENVGTSTTTTVETTERPAYVATNRSDYAREPIPAIATRPEVTTQTTTTEVAQAPTTEETVAKNPSF
jgi:hypothetical protein